MARKWTDGDSARLMTVKYNETAEEVSKLQKVSNEVNQATQEELNKLQKKVDTKIETVTKEDIGLGNVNNTADEDKPVSKLQAKAIDNAVEGMLTSEPANELEGEVGFITSVSVSGTTLVISKV